MNYFESISKITSFLSNIASIITTLLGLYITWSFTKWKKEKQFERKADEALRLLKKVRATKLKMRDWLEYHNLVVKIDGDESPYTLKNYEKRGKSILASLEYIAMYGKYLDKNIPSLVKNITQYFQGKRTSFTITFAQIDMGDLKKKALLDLASYKLDALEKMFNPIEDKLNSYAYFEN